MGDCLWEPPTHAYPGPPGAGPFPGTTRKEGPALLLPPELPLTVDRTP